MKLKSPVANPSKIIGAPVNYHAHIDEANADITHVSALITDVLSTRDDPQALEGLRPMYIEYLKGK